MNEILKRMSAAMLLAVLIAATGPAASSNGGRRVIYEGVVTELAAAEPSNDLWVTLKDLTRATRFAVKPQGVCRDELCFPIPKDRKAQFLVKKGGVTWFNLSEFARLTKQPTAYDEKHATWFFGPRPGQQNAFLSSLDAPEFSLPGMNGTKHSLSDFRGKKVFLVTWASW